MECAWEKVLAKIFLLGNIFIHVLILATVLFFKIVLMYNIELKKKKFRLDYRRVVGAHETTATNREPTNKEHIPIYIYIYAHKVEYYRRIYVRATTAKRNNK